MGQVIQLDPARRTKRESLKTADIVSQQEQVFQYIRAAKKEGRTSHEVAAHFKRDIRAVNKSITNLIVEGRIRYTSFTRPGPNGKANAVVRYVPKFELAKKHADFSDLFREYEARLKEWKDALTAVQLRRDSARICMSAIHRKIVEYRKAEKL